MKVITVHGIRRNNRWYEKFEQIPEVREANIEVLSFDYGYFGFLKFINRAEREKIIDKFCEFYDQHVQGTNDPPSVIAHSFGTYIVYMAMKRYNTIKFRGIIFCGSILNSELDFRPLLDSNQFSNLLNDHGNREWFLKYTRYIVDEFCGKAGHSGFKDIPPKFIKMMENRSNYQRHSDYFLPNYMKGNWLPFLLKNKYKNDYNKDVLRPEIIERIYSNLKNNIVDFEVIKKSFFARIDKNGNYFAKYEIKGLNNRSTPINDIYFTTTADGFHEADKMDFLVFNEKNENLYCEAVEDKTHFKKIVINLNEPIKYKEDFLIKTYFCWLVTMSLKKGDTDHWAIKDTPNVYIQLNFPYELKSSRIYKVKDKEIIDQLILQNVIEKDGSYTYYIEYQNLDKADGLVFYYEGIKRDSIVKLPSPVHINLENRKRKIDPIIDNIVSNNSLKLNINNKKTYSIFRASQSDLKKIYKLEVDIEYSNAANEQTIKDRINMFNDGFLVIKDNSDNIIGYIETIIWNEKPFSRFEEISNFPMHYNVRGDSLYIIFLAVSKKYRRQGFASSLLKEIENLARRYNHVKTIRLVAKDGLVNFYSKRGFLEIKELPQFLEGKNYKSILMEKKLY